MPIPSTKQSQLNILTLRETANGTLSDQIKNVSQFISWSGKKLIGLIYQPRPYPQAPYERTNSDPTEKSQTDHSHTLTSTDSNPQTSTENSSHASTSHEIIAARLLASAALGLTLGGLPGAVACSGATFTGIQIKKAVASQEQKILSTLALITLNLVTVSTLDAHEIYAAYSEGRYDVLTIILTKAPANLLIGSILQPLIQSYMASIANHCLPESAQPKNNELTLAVCSGLSDAIALSSSPILRREFATISNHFFRFPLTSAQNISPDNTSIALFQSGDNSSLSISPSNTYSQAISLTSFMDSSTLSSMSKSPRPTPPHYPKLVYSTNITHHAIVDGNVALNIGKNPQSWNIPNVWALQEEYAPINLPPNQEKKIPFDYLSNKFQGTLTLNKACPIKEVEFDIQWGENHNFHFSASNATIHHHINSHHQLIHKIDLLFLSEEKARTLFQISFQPMDNTTCFAQLISVKLSALPYPYHLKISPSQIQYYLDPSNVLASPTPSTTFTPTLSPDDSINHIKLGILGGEIAFIVVACGGTCICTPCIVHQVKQIRERRDSTMNENTPLLNPS